MKVLGIHRVELVVHEPEKEAAVLHDLFGMEFHRSETPQHGVLSMTDFPNGLEIAGPSGASESKMTPILEGRGEGLLTTVWRVESVEDVLDMARKNDIEVLVDLDLGDSMPGHRGYRQVSLSSDRFPAGASFTFCEFSDA